jgi:hypothetical protein
MRGPSLACRTQSDRGSAGSQGARPATANSEQDRPSVRRVADACPCRKLKLEHIDGVARQRSATNARALFGTHHAEPARPCAAICVLTSL